MNQRSMVVIMMKRKLTRKRLSKRVMRERRKVRKVI